MGRPLDHAVRAFETGVPRMDARRHLHAHHRLAVVPIEMRHHIEPLAIRREPIGLRDARVAINMRHADRCVVRPLLDDLDAFGPAKWHTLLGVIGIDIPRVPTARLVYGIDPEPRRRAQRFTPARFVDEAQNAPVFAEGGTRWAFSSRRG